MVIQRIKALFIECLLLMEIYCELFSDTWTNYKRMKCTFNKHVWIDEWIDHVRFRQKCKNCGMLLSDYLCGVRK